jgi:hypothetical protein
VNNVEQTINGVRIEIYPDPLPEGFNEWFRKTLAECVAEGIVEKAVRRIHDRDKTTGIDK